jgi:hypothetical protein
MNQTQREPERVIRFDQEAYLEDHRGLYERNIRILRRMDGLPEKIRQDANLTGFLARELVYVRGEIERTIYERLLAPSFVPVETNHPRGAMSYAAPRIDQVGVAKITHDLAGDAPRADIVKEEDLRKYVNVRGSYGYTVQDLEWAAFSQVPLQRWKADACAAMIARGVDKIGKSGDAATGLTGFFNSAGVTLKTLTNGEWTSTGTADEIKADFASIEADVIAASKDTQPMNYRLVLPTTAEGRLATLAHSAGSDMTLKEWLQKTSRLGTVIERYNALDSAVSPDVVAADPPQGIFYPRDPQVLFWPIPILYEEQPPQVNGWEWIVQARARVGGVDVRRPFNMLYIENLD